MDDVLDEHHSAVDQDAEIYCAHRDQVGRERSEEHTSELQSRLHLVCRLLLEKKNNMATRSVSFALAMLLPRRSQPTPPAMTAPRCGAVSPHSLVGRWHTLFLSATM